MSMPRKLSVLLLVTALNLQAEDWPTYRHDNRRSGVSSEQLPAQLKEAWTYKSPAPPQTAWSGPAKWDAFSGNKDLQSMRNFDPAFFVTTAGQDVYFGSSVDNAVHCIDARTGKERWVFFTDSAVRFPPTAANGKLYFGSDDGFAYCIDAKTAEEVWRHRPLVDKRHAPSNGKLISLWPCRTGVLVQGKRAYFAASMLPWEASYLCAVDAQTGKPEGAGCFEAKQTKVTLQGALLASSDSLYVPQGRAAPLVFDKATGKSRGSIPNAGGTYCLLTEDDQLISGPKNQKEKDQVLQVADGTKRNHLLTFQGTNRMLVNKGFAYLHQGESLTALDRVPYAARQAEKRQLLGKQAAIAKQLKSRKNDQGLKAEHAELGKQVQRITAELPTFFKWKIPCKHPIGFAMGGKTLYVGGNGIVQAYDATHGKELWSGKIEGRGYGLAISNGRLLVSTDRGYIHCFK